MKDYSEAVAHTAKTAHAVGWTPYQKSERNQSVQTKNTHTTQGPTPATPKP